MERPCDLSKLAEFKNLILNDPRTAVSKFETSMRQTSIPASYTNSQSFFHRTTLSSLCWGSLLDAGLPQLLIAIFRKELENTESGKTHIYLVCILSTASQYFKTAMVRDCHKCLATFVDQANPHCGSYMALSSTPRSRYVNMGSAWSINVVVRKRNDQITVRWHYSYLQCGKAPRRPVRPWNSHQINWLWKPDPQKLELVAESADEKLVVACNHQIDQGHRKFDRNIFHYAVHWIYDLLYRLDPERDPRMTAIVESNVFKFLARASILSAQSNEHHEFVDILVNILKTHIRHGEILSGLSMWELYDSDLHEDVCSRFSHYFMPVVRNLRASPNTRTTKVLLDAWRNVAASLDVEEDEPGAGSEDIASSVCSWKECHGLERPNKLKQCSRCRLTRYCRSNCQRRDWDEGHKGTCSKRGV